MSEEKRIRYIVANALGITIPPKGWRQAFGEADTQGRLDNKSILTLLTIILERLEENESQSIS